MMRFWCYACSQDLVVHEIERSRIISPRSSGNFLANYELDHFILIRKVFYVKDLRV